MKNDINEYVYECTIPDTIFYSSKIKLFFEDTKEQLEHETNYRIIKKHKEHIRRG